MTNYEIMNMIYRNVSREYNIHPNDILLDILELAENRVNSYLDTDSGWLDFMLWIESL